MRQSEQDRTEAGNQRASGRAHAYSERVRQDADRAMADDGVEDALLQARGDLVGTFSQELLPGGSEGFEAGRDAERDRLAVARQAIGHPSRRMVVLTGGIGYPRLPIGGRHLRDEWGSRSPPRRLLGRRGEGSTRQQRQAEERGDPDGR